MDHQDQWDILFNRAPLAMYLIDSNMHILNLNDLAASISRFSKDDSKGKRSGEILGCMHALEKPEGCGFSKDCPNCKIRNTILETFEFREDRKSIEASIVDISESGNNEYWFVISTSFIANPEGDKAIVALEDITERIKTERELEESENRYSNIFRNNHSIMLVIDPENGQIVDANPAAMSFYGWSLKEITSRKIQEINTLTNEEVEEEMMRAKSEQRNHFHFRHFLASGDVREVEVYSGPVAYKGKKILYSIIHDVTDRIEAENKLEESEQTARALLNASTESAFLIDRKGTFLTMNEVTAKRLKRDSDEIVGKKAFDFLPPDVASKRKAMIQKAIDSKKPVREIDERNGIVLDNSLFPILDSSGEVSRIAVFATDITERKKAEKEKEKLIEELQGALKEIKTLSGLIPICAHCKKIRDDKGYWNSLESYIESHTEGQFSHGLCPHCMDEIYADEKWYKEKKKQEEKE